jgi:hypothetical protein
MLFAAADICEVVTGTGTHLYGKGAADISQKRPGLDPGSVQWELWRAKWDLGRFFSE